MGWSVSKRDRVLVNGMGCCELDGALVNGMVCWETGWRVTFRDGVL